MPLAPTSGGTGGAGGNGSIDGADGGGPAVEALPGRPVARIDDPSIAGFGRQLHPLDCSCPDCSGTAARQRRAVLHETLIQLADPADRAASLVTAQANVARWAATATAGPGGGGGVGGGSKFEVVEGDWGDVASALTHGYGRCFAVLDMANAYGAGGGYVEGMLAQEENMFRRTDCHFSITAETGYDRQRDRYVPDKTSLLQAEDGRVYLDMDRPRVCMRGPERRESPDLGYEWMRADQIFPFYELRAAAVDLRRTGGRGFDVDETHKRVAAQLDTLIDKGVRHVVLSAFGCGAFMNPVESVARCYRMELEARAKHFDKVAFAIFHPGYGPDNFTPFKAAFGGAGGTGGIGDADGGGPPVAALPALELHAKVELVDADITTLAVDAIVNAANPDLSGGDGVCGAMFAAAGPLLPAACQEQDTPVAVGDCRLTPGFNLPAQHIVHCVGPRIQASATSPNGRDVAALASCYTMALDLCRRNDIGSIAFCCISTGIFNFSNRLTAGWRHPRPIGLSSGALFSACKSRWTKLCTMSCLTSMLPLPDMMALRRLPQTLCGQLVLWAGRDGRLHSLTHTRSWPHMVEVLMMEQAPRSDRAFRLLTLSAVTGKLSGLTWVGWEEAPDMLPADTLTMAVAANVLPVVHPVVVAVVVVDVGTEDAVNTATAMATDLACTIGGTHGTELTSTPVLSSRSGRNSGGSLRATGSTTRSTTHIVCPLHRPRPMHWDGSSPSRRTRCRCQHRFPWATFLRLLPETILTDLRRGGREPTVEIGYRLDRWRDYDWADLTTEERPPQSNRPPRADPGADPELETALSRSARHAMDMEISRAAAALEPGSTAPTNQVNFDAIAALHPTPTPFHTPAGEDTPLQRAMAAPRIEIADKVVFKAAISMQKSTALWLQPYHLRVIAQIPLGAKRLARVCNLVINGEVPERIKPLIYDHKIFALDKASKHQADLEARVAAVAAAADSEAPVPKPKLRPIAIGCALLRLAEKSYATQMKEVFRRHLMPLQFGVAVPGGLNLWSTVVEAMLQDNPNSVFLGIDLTNCFNAMSRDHLIDECLQHAELRPLARHIAGTYPPGMLAWVRVEEAWAAVNFQSGCAQGRPLSAALAGILLGLALKAAKLAMATAAGLPLDSEAADRAFAAGAYIVDAGLIGEPAVVAAGFVAFKAAVEERGWKINLTKTVLGAAFYADIDPDAKTALDEELRVLLDPLDPERKIPIVWDGMVFLGTPSGAERNGPNTRPRADRHAPMPAGGTYYRETTVEGFIDDHDIRLRRTVQLAQRDGRSCSELTALSKMFAIVILRFSCNSRDVHLIRRLPKRIIAEAAARHDRGIKFAWAAINGHAILPPETVTDDDGTIRRVYLHEQPQDSYPEHYDLSYD